MRRFLRLTSMLDIENAIVLAPMAGGTSTPELVAAVSNAGGLGSFGAGYLPPGDLAKAIARIRALTDSPFAVNLFAGGYDGTGTSNPARILHLLATYHQRLGLPAPTLPSSSLPPFDEQLEAVISSDVPVFSFTFGIPSPDVLDRLRKHGVKIIGTATTVAEARTLEAAGVDAIVGQGSEAGAHRGTFLAAPEESLVGTLALIPQIVDAVRVPVIASGGIMDGRGIVASAALGASGVQMGTAFMLCPESGVSRVHRNAIRAARDDSTTLTRAFSGRLARGIANSFTKAMAEHERWFLPYPAQNNLTRAMRTAAGKQGDADLISLWAGQAASMAREMPASELVKLLVRETNEVASALSP